MGTSSSHHQEPVDRASFGGSFKRSTSLRHSKSKGTVRSSQRKMDKIRSSFRESFRRKKDPVPELTKQQQWQIDSTDVRTGNCCFHVKYLGCLEVFESRGMQVCEEALKVLRSSRRRPIKAILFVSGDGLRVVEDDSKGLIVDQTIEKVSFCAPDRNNERGFSYICRDGTTRRWLCHGFLAINESGERLSHAVGCAFALCLERKQNREKENVAGSIDSDNKRTAASSVSTSTAASISTTAANTGTTSTTPTGQAVVAAAVIPANIVAAYAKINNATKKENIPVKRTVPVTIHPIERPHATYSMLQRQGSFRGLSHLNQASPFKRQLSLKISDLPSNIERTTRLRNLVRSNESTIIPPYAGSSTAAAAADAAVGNNVDSTAIETNSINNVFIAKVDAVSLQNSDVSATGNIFSDNTIRRNFPLYSMNNRSMDDIRGSLKRSASFTPPPTPPPVSFVGELPRPEQWLGKVSEITSNISELTANITELDGPVPTSVAADREPASSKSPTVPKSPNARRNQPLAYHGKAHSLGSAIEKSYAIAVVPSSLNAIDSSDPTTTTTTTTTASVTDALPSNDPFDVEWALGITQQQQQQSQQALKNTNPFLSSTTTTTIS